MCITVYSKINHKIHGYGNTVYFTGDELSKDILISMRLDVTGAFYYKNKEIFEVMSRRTEIIVHKLGMRVNDNTDVKNIITDARIKPNIEKVCIGKTNYLFIQIQPNDIITRFCCGCNIDSKKCENDRIIDDLMIFEIDVIN